jgi:hypothetical protein
VITIDSYNGAPFYTGIPFVDLFPDHSLAVDSLARAKKLASGCGLIGLSVAERSLTIALVDRVAITGRLPGCHEVRTIRHALYIFIPLPGCTHKSSPFDEFQLADNHFYCETYDITRLFPTNSAVSDNGFVWNLRWREPFIRLGIPNACVHLLQGVCRTSNFTQFDFQITYIARRSVLNPGTRYAARGLNGRNSPGNEVECELIFYRGNDFWTVQWRRGSIPIRWKTTLTSSLAAPQHRVDADYFNGTAEYFLGLQERFGADIPIRCVSLLESELEHAEEQIKDYFALALGRLYEAGVQNVFFIPFDLNRHLHSDGSSEAMMDFISFIGPLAESDGFNIGTLPNSIRRRQQGLMRFNCADSLDRTNIATFYFSFKLAAVWCKEQKVGLGPSPDADSNLPNLIVDQSIVDFLAAAFVDSGNVISYLYTNTMAIKIGAIRRFSPSVQSQQSDTSVTMQRRLQNVVNDPQRQKVIELWTQRPRMRWFHRIDPRHVFVVPNGKPLPRGILDLDQHYFRLSRSQNELLLCFACPVQLISLLLLLYPSSPDEAATRMSIAGGLSLEVMTIIIDLPLPLVVSPTWCRWRLQHDQLWSLDPLPGLYLRFLRITFQVWSDNFVIGNMRFDVKSVFSEDPPSIPRAPREPDAATVARFLFDFEAFVGSRRGIPEVLRLEQIRIGLRVRQSFIQRSAVGHGINPWLADACGRLLVSQSPNCIMCGQAEMTEFESFKQGKVLRGLIEHSAEPTLIRMCPACWEAGDHIVQMSELYQQEFTPAIGDVPVFQIGEPDPEMLVKTQTFTSDSTAAFLMGGSPVLHSREGGAVVIKPEAPRRFSMFIVQHAIMLDIWAVADSSNFIIISREGIALTKQERGPNLFSFSFPSPEIASTLEFSIMALESVVVIRKLQLLYIITKLPCEDPNVVVAFPQVKFAVNPEIALYNAAERTDAFRLQKTTLSKFQVEIVIDKSSPVPLSFIFAAYLEGRLMFSRHYILPELENGKKIWYLLERPVETDSVKIFYLDRLRAIRPHLIKLGLD